MEKIIQPIKKEFLLSELTEDKFLRKANYGNSDLYLFDGRTSPYLMQELGRLRELTFRAAGGGTGLSADIDKYDLADDPYFQLIVWDPEGKEIVGGYRYLLGESVLDAPQEKLASAHLFDYSNIFLKKYLPYSIELGRSFIQPNYQPKNDRKKGLFALDNLWDGLGALIVEYPDVKYFLGKVTMYKNFNVEARNYLLTFIYLYFFDKEKLVNSKNAITIDYKKYKKIFTCTDFKTDYKILVKILKKYDEKIPPLINAYINLSKTIITFGTVENDEFGDVEETGILINIAEIFSSAKDRHVLSYERVIKLYNLLPRTPKFDFIKSKFIKKEK
ncbi:MAG: GNAT family N-acetyltransferase [Bacteroidales bacterium]|jgi:hypothetical protein|nr:GNAT family N-acetyltransferase [Bacteroidales bacterium]